MTKRRNRITLSPWMRDFEVRHLKIRDQMSPNYLSWDCSHWIPSPLVVWEY
ncbi:hypothetical protein Hanom_Chr15g01344521 [Helianthus anomalus]